MDQVSRPMLVALIAVVGFAGVWMLALRPGAAAEPPLATTPPPAAPAVPAAEPGPRPEPMAASAASPPATVVAFVGDGEDDALARELVGTLRGVRTQIVPIDRIGAHEDLLGAIEIRSTPTILVVGADRRAQRLEGLPDAVALQQALAAAR